MAHVVRNHVAIGFTQHMRTQPILSRATFLPFRGFFFCLQTHGLFDTVNACEDIMAGEGAKIMVSGIWWS